MQIFRILLLVILLGPSVNAQVLVNGGFETGDLSGWSLVPGSQAFVVGAPFFNGGIPENGTPGTFAALETGGPGSEPTDTVLETALGLTPGSLDAFSTGNAIEGSAIFQTVNAVAGSVLSFDARFVSDELFAGDPAFNDFGFFSLTGAAPQQLLLLGDTLSPDAGPVDGGIFPSSAAPVSANIAIPTTGTYTFGFGVLDVGDQRVQSALTLNNVALRAPAMVPEIDSSAAAVPMIILVVVLLLFDDRKAKSGPASLALGES